MFKQLLLYRKLIAQLWLQFSFGSVLSMDFLCWEFSIQCETDPWIRNSFLKYMPTCWPTMSRWLLTYSWFIVYLLYHWLYRQHTSLFKLIWLSCFFWKLPGSICQLFCLDDNLISFKNRWVFSILQNKYMYSMNECIPSTCYYCGCSYENLWNQILLVPFKVVLYVTSCFSKETDVMDTATCWI